MSRSNENVRAMRQAHADEGTDATPRRMKWARACQGRWRYGRAHDARFERSRPLSSSPLETC